MSSEPDSDPLAGYWRGVHEHSREDIKAVCYPDRTRAFNRYIAHYQHLALSRLLIRHGIETRGQTVLDVGTGRGRWVDFYSRLGAAAVGIDVAREALVWAHRSLPSQRFAQASATALPFAGASFDLASSITVLMHLPREAQEPAVREVARVLRPGGHFVLLESTWQDPSPVVIGRSLDDWTALLGRHSLGVRAAEGHFYHLAFRSLRRLPGASRIVPLVDAAAVALGYPSEWLLLSLKRDRPSGLALQHFLLARKE